MLASRLSVVVMDKTGTVTRGRPQVVDVLPADGVEERTLLASAAAAEQLSGHPLAGAVVKCARERGIAVPLAMTLETLPGAGVRAEVNFRPVVVGNETVLEETGGDTSALVKQMTQLRVAGKIPLAVVVAGTTVNRQSRSESRRRIFRFTPKS